MNRATRRLLVVLAATSVLVGSGTAMAKPEPRRPKPPKPAAEAAPTDYIALAPQLSKAEHPSTVRESFEVEMADGTHLYTEIVRPDPAVHGNGPWPVILEASPYHGTLADRDGTRIFPDPVDAEGDLVGLTGYFAPRGYAVAMVDLRGTGQSSGCLDHLGQNDGRDLKTVIEWLATQPWSNGRVGMTGHSYVGSTPAVAAAQRPLPNGLVTIAPSAGLASMYDHQFNKGVPYLLQWAGPQWAYEALALSRHLPPGLEAILNPTGNNVFGNTGDDFGGDPETTGCGLPNSALTAGSGQVTGEYQAWHAERDWRAGAQSADIPIFMIHGANDNAARIPASEWFFGGRFGRPGDKVWIGQWDHGSTNGRCGDTEGTRALHPTCRFEQFQYALHAWFDKHLKQMDVSTGPAVEAFLNGSKPVDVSAVSDPATWDTRVVAKDAWTAPTSWLSLYPDASDPENLRLRTTAPTATGTATFGTTADALLAGVGRTSVEFTSEPFATRTVLLGVPKMMLHAAQSTIGQVDIVTTLWREDAEGNRERVSFCAIQPALRHSVETPVAVTPGEEMELPLQCFTMAHWVAAGQKLVLEVGTTSPHHASLGSDPEITLFTGPGRGSYDLPALPSTTTLHADVPLRSVPPPEFPLGPAQPAIHDTAPVGIPGGPLAIDGATVTTYEFESLAGYDNAAMNAAVTDVEGDVDLWLDRKAADGSWTEVTSGTNGFDVGGPETLAAGRLLPGIYRLRIANFASVPGDAQVDITFLNQDGMAGEDSTSTMTETESLLVQLLVLVP